jgi:two-component system, chemotaxis family, protein-glutamate methylesterase/glutaminase
MARELVVIGSSKGGARTLPLLLADLPPDFPAAVAAVQHRGPELEVGGLASFLRSRSALPLREAEDSQPIEPGVVHLAPADYHLLVEGASFALSTDAPLRHARPSIDVLFESAAEAYGERLVGIVLTGTGKDGAAGLRRIGRRGGFTIVQDPATCERHEMPEAAIAACRPKRVVPVEEMAQLLVELCAARGRAA